MSLTGALASLKNRARISDRLLVVGVLVATTLGLADTDADRTSVVTRGMVPIPELTITVTMFSTPAAEARMANGPDVAGAVKL